MEELEKTNGRRIVGDTGYWHLSPRWRHLLPYVPYVLLFAYYFVTHLLVDWEFGDYTDLLESYQQYGFAEYLVRRWTKWTSRVILEAIAMQLTPLTWAVLDSGAFVLALHSISVITDVRRDAKSMWVLFALMLCYPLVDQASAGWIMTTSMYVFPLALLLYVFSAFARCMRREAMSPARTVATTLAAVVAGNSEQAVALMLCVTLVLTVWEWAQGRRHALLFVILGVSAMSLLVVAMCPGNAARLSYETDYWMPEFVNFSFAKKLALGIASTVDRCIHDANVPSLVFASMLALAVWARPGAKPWERVIATVPIVIIVCASFLVQFLNQNFAYVVERLLTRPDLEAGEFSKWSFVLDLVYVASLLVATAVVFGLEPKGLLVVAIVAAGLCSRFMMGFTPTIFASGNRTFIFLDYSLIIASIFAYPVLQGGLKDRDLWRARFFLEVIAFLSALNSALSAAYFHW